MKAYVELVQRKERDLGTDMLTHQKVRLALLLSAGSSADLTWGNLVERGGLRR